MMYKKLLIVFGLLVLCNLANAQQEGGRLIRNQDEESTEDKEGQAAEDSTQEVKPRRIRNILNKITFTSSLGYGINNYRQSLEGYTLDFQEGQYYLVDGSEGITNWTNSPISERGLNQSETQASGDTISLRGLNHSLPINIGLHVLIKERFKIGGGVGLELFSIGTLAFKEPAENFQEYETDVSSALALRYYGTLGYRTMHFLFWDHYADIRVGKRVLLTQFSDDVSTGLFFNAGYQLERSFSEYFRFTLRPSMEYHAFTSTLSKKEDSPFNRKEIKTSVPSAYLEAGVSLNYPRLPRCPIKHCETQVDHVHYGNQYRGQPITKWQNPKMGQNHRELQRNKRRKKDDTEQQRQYKKPKKSFFPWFR
jgi:hypothetical protein